MLSDYELGWLVGILEGEANFGIASHAKTVHIAIKMTDEDIVNKVAVLFERIIGSPVNVRGKKADREGWTDQVEVKIYGDNARKVMLYIVKHMGWRRRQKIWQSLNGHRVLRKNELTSSTADILKLVI